MPQTQAIPSSPPAGASISLLKVKRSKDLSWGSLDSTSSYPCLMLLLCSFDTFPALPSGYRWLKDQIKSMSIVYRVYLLRFL